MFDELDKYENSDHFFLTPQGDLKVVCNAPTDKSGVYLVYALKNGHIELIYIGRSGNINANHSIQNAGSGGLKESIVNGLQFGNVPRHISWISQMKMERIEALDVYWYAIDEQDLPGGPGDLENTLLQKHHLIYGRLPAWNQEL